MFKLGAVWADGNYAVNKDGVYGAENVAGAGYTTSSLALNIAHAASSGDGNLQAIKYRNLQRYDITSYAEGKTIIDGLMT
jgi:hypothetical protein